MKLEFFNLKNLFDEIQEFPDECVINKRQVYPEINML
jgi:hypothetical protein